MTLEIRNGYLLSESYLDKLIDEIDELYQIHYPNHESKIDLLNTHLTQLKRDYEIIYVNEYREEKIYSVGLKRVKNER